MTQATVFANVLVLSGITQCSHEKDRHVLLFRYNDTKSNTTQYITRVLDDTFNVEKERYNENVIKDPENVEVIRVAII